MADEFDTGCRGVSNGFDGGAGASEPQVDRPRADRINKKRLEGLSDSGKVLQIFYRPTKGGPLVECKEIKNVPREVAGICSDLIDKKVILKGNTIFFLPDAKKDEDPIPIDAWKFVFEWITKCGEMMTDVSIKDDFPLPQPPENEDGLGPIINILRAAQKLRVPYDSFQKFVIKQMMPLSRKYLIRLDLVKKIYDPTSEYAAFPELQGVAWTSIFDHWYMYKLESEEWDDYMEELSDLRLAIEQLDDDLKVAIEKKDDALKAARERKRAKDVGEDNAGRDGGWNNTESEAFGGGGVTDYNACAQNAAGVTTNDYDMGAQNDASGNGDWAEEMNNDYQHNSGFDPAPAPPAGGW